jgi:hypothetical protein
MARNDNNAELLCREEFIPTVWYTGGAPGYYGLDLDLLVT